MKFFTRFNIALILFLTHYFPSIAQKIGPREVLLKSADLLKTSTFFQYDTKYQIKFFDSKDTTKIIEYKCIVFKAPSDTVLNYFAKVYNDLEERIYDGINCFLIWHPLKKIIKNDPHDINKSFIKNNIKREHIPRFFYSKNPFNTYLTGAKDIKLESVILDGKKCWKIDVILPTDEEITYTKHIVFIEQENLLPVRIQGFAKFQDIQDEFWELKIERLTVKSEKEINISNYYNYPSNYTEEVFKAPNINYNLLPNGTKLIPFQGKDILGKSYSVDTNNIIIPKLILIDFWYLACGPCLAAMPKLARLSQKYKKDLTVLGLNSFDDPASKASEIKKFSKRFSINYPLLTINRSVSDSYLVNSYPTVYLIKNGEIIYSHFGSNDKDMAELEKVISRNVAK